MLTKRSWPGSWRTRILIGLGLLILGVAVWITVVSFVENQAKNSGWTTYSQKNSGLISDNAYSVALDQDGRAWIGTINGISVFDGDGWTTYTSENSGLVRDEVRVIAMGPEGRVWVGTAGGANAKTGEQWITYPATASSLPMSRYITGIVTDPSGRVWFGTSGDGIRILDGSHWTILRMETSGLLGNYANALGIDPEGRVWVGTNKGVSIFDKAALSSAPELTSALVGKDVRAIAFDPEGNPWVGTRNRGAFFFDGEAWRPDGPQNTGGLAGDTVEAIAIDGQGRPYLLAENQLSVLVDDEWAIFNSRNSGMASHGNRDLAIDADGRIWIASGAGLTVATPGEGDLPSRTVGPVEAEPSSRTAQGDDSRSRPGFGGLLSCFSMALIALLPLIWLVIFLKDPGIPIAFLLAGLAWSMMSILNIGVEDGAPAFIAGGILIGGVIGGIAGGVVRRLTKKGVILSLAITILGCLAGIFLGQAFMAFWWMGF